VTFEVRYPGDQYARLQELANELVKLRVDVIASLGPPATLAAQRATKTIPIVMETLSDVVSTGLVTNLARPGGNLTGVAGFASELSGKRLELIREILPQADRIAVFVNRANPTTVPTLSATESAAQQMRMKLHVVDVRQLAELGAAFEAARRERADALVLLADPLLFSARPQIVQLAARHRMPTVYETRLFPDAGGLFRKGRSLESGSSAWRSRTGSRPCGPAWIPRKRASCASSWSTAGPCGRSVSAPRRRVKRPI